MWIWNAIWYIMMKHGMNHQNLRGTRWEVLCGKVSAKKVFEKCRLKEKSAKNVLQSTNGDWRAPKLVEVHWQGGGGGSECGMKRAVLIQAEGNQWWLSRTLPAENCWIGEASGNCSVQSSRGYIDLVTAVLPLLSIYCEYAPCTLAVREV